MRSEARAALLFLSPALVLLTVFFFVPVVAGFALSLTDFDLYTIGDPHNVRMVGFRNYKELLTSGIFWTAFGTETVPRAAASPRS